MNKNLSNKAQERVANMTRMLAKAWNENVQVTPMYNRPGFYIALSTGNRGAYVVQPGNKANGCNCMGYQHHGYCKHYAAAAKLHKLPIPEPKICPGCGEWHTPEQLAEFGVCAACNDRQLEQAYSEHQDEALYSDDMPDWDYLESLDTAGFTAG